MKSNIDDVKKFWNNRPCNIRHSSKEMGTKDFFDEIDRKRYFVEPHIKDFADFESWKNKEVLEIGCGIGTDTIRFAKAGAKVTAIDLSSNSIDVAKKRSEVYGLSESINFICASAEDLDSVLGDKKFDLIYSFGVIHHTPQPENVYSKIASHLEDDGEFKVMVYNKYSWRTLEILFENGNPLKSLFHLDEAIAKYSEAQIGCPVTYSYSKTQFKNILESNGLVVTRFDIRHIFRWKVQEYIKHKYVSKAIWRFIPNFIYDFLQNTIGWHHCVTAKRTKNDNNIKNN